MVWKSQQNNSVTLQTHTDPSRCSHMIPYKLSVKWCALQSSKSTSTVCYNGPEDVEENTKISSTVYSGLEDATKLNY